MEVENPPASIEQWYRRATALDRNWRESRREEERLRGRKEQGGGATKQEQRQILPRPLVWQRRQQLPQQATTGPAPMEEVKRMNAVVVRGQGQGAGIPPRQDPFAMEVDHGRNCYACGGFRHMAHHCRNRGRGMLWQPLDTKSNDHTSNKSLRQISSGKFTRELDKEPLLN